MIEMCYGGWTQRCAERGVWRQINSWGGIGDRGVLASIGGRGVLEEEGLEAEVC